MDGLRRAARLLAGLATIALGAGCATGTTTPESSASPSPSEEPSSGATPTLPVPPRPNDVTFDDRVRDIGGERYEHTYTVTWRSPLGEGVEMRIYGVAECLSEPPSPPEGASGPCLFEHTPLPSPGLQLIATAPASNGTASWTWIDEYGGCEVVPIQVGPDGTKYRAVVLAAYAASGHSIFAIAEPGSWYQPGPSDMPC